MWGVERDHRASVGRPGVLGESLAVAFWASSVVSVVSPRVAVGHPVRRGSVPCERMTG